MQSTSFNQQGTLSSTYDNNKIYIPSVDGEYPEAFSVGYVKSSNIPPQFIPSYFKANYAPDVNTERDAVLIPDIQDSVYDVFLGGLNNSSSIILNGDSMAVAGFNTREYDRRESNPNFTKRIGSYQIYGECDVRGMSMPSAIQICIKFTGMKNGNSILYETVFNRNFNIDELIAVVKNNDNQYSITDGNITFNLQDFKDNRYLFVDEGTDNGTCGFYWLCYSFVGWGRNKDSSDNLGNYSYLFPSIGVQLGEIQETISEAVNKYATWNITSLYGTAPYGTAKRYLGGPGFRTRATGAGLYPGTYYEEEGISEIYQAELQNASYASFLTLGYSLNVSGFTCCAPIQPSTGSMISQWTYTDVRDYSTKLSPANEQLILFVPEGRGDFGTTVQIASINDAWKHACLVPVWCRPGYEYNFATTTENFWYAEMDGYEFVGNLVRGDDPSLQDKVPEWILDGDSTLNEYEPETDRPADDEDDDPSGEPTNDKKGKEKATKDEVPAFFNRSYQIGNTVSFYALSASEVSALRYILMQQSDDFYNAVKKIGASSFYEFINSFRFWPINLDVSSNAHNVSFANELLKFNDNPVQYKVLTNPSGSETICYKNTYICFWNLSKLTWENNFLDYEPYTKLTLTLPYAGTFDLDLLQISAFGPLSSAFLKLYATIDYETGTLCYCLALSNSSTETYNDDLVPLLVKQVKIAVDIALNANNATAQSDAILNAGFNNIQKTLNLVNAGTNMVTTFQKPKASVGNKINATTGLIGAVADSAKGVIDYANATRAIPITIGANSGSIASTFYCQHPYLSHYHTRTANPDNYSSAIGYLWEGTATIKNLSGFSIARNPNLKNISATEEEKNLISEILTTGFYA